MQFIIAVFVSCPYAVSRIMITDFAREAADHAPFKQINPLFRIGYQCLKDVNTLEVRSTYGTKHCNQS